MHISSIFYIIPFKLRISDSNWSLSKHMTKKLTKSINYIFTLTIIFSSMGMLSSDLYLPSLPSIVQDLHTTVSLTQLSLAIFIFGFAIARLVMATLSDAIGRKKALIIGLLICLIGCVCCLFATNITTLLIGRLLQGFGAGGSNVLGRVILRDKVEGPMLAKYLSYFSMATITVAASAPLLGGYIEHYFNWHVTFMVLLLYTIFALITAIFILPETNEFKHTDFIKPNILKINLKILFAEPTFLLSMLLLALGYAAFTAWLTAGPIVLQQVVHLTPIEFGWCAAAVSLSYFVSVLINSKLVNKFGLLKMQQFGAKCMLAAGIIILIPILFFHHISTAAFVLPVMMALFGMGMITPNAFTTGLTPFAKIAGIATAILASVQMVGGFIGSTIISLAPEHSQLPVGLVIFTCGIIAVILVSLLKRANK